MKWIMDPIEWNFFNRTKLWLYFYITYIFSERKSWRGGITRILSVDNLAWLLRIVLNNHKYFTLILITGELIVLFIVLHVIVYEWCYMYRANTTSWTDVRHDLVSQQVKLHLRSLSRLLFFHFTIWTPSVQYTPLKR